MLQQQGVNLTEEQRQIIPLNVSEIEQYLK